MEGLICPKCHGTMRNYERSGVTVDQCTECRGIFLDRGELEKLVDAENTHYSSPQPAPQQREREYRPEREHHDEREYRGEHHGGGHYGKKKKRSFLEDLFD